MEPSPGAASAWMSLGSSYLHSSRIGAEHGRQEPRVGDAPPTGRRSQEGPQMTARCGVIGISLMISDVEHLFMLHVESNNQQTKWKLTHRYRELADSCQRGGGSGMGEKVKGRERY